MEKPVENKKSENRKMLLGFVVIIAVMVLSYVLFPSGRRAGEEGFDFGREIEDLKQQISDIDFSNGGASATTTPVATSTDFFDFEMEGPGGCSTLQECDDYCSIPENLQECQEYFGSSY